MKANPLIPTTAAAVALAVASCAPGPFNQPAMRPSADVEELERQAPVTGTPNVGQHEAGRNAVDYGLDRRYHPGRYGYGY